METTKDLASFFQIKEYIFHEYYLDPAFPIMAIVRENYRFQPEPQILHWLHFHTHVEIMYCHHERIVDVENTVQVLHPGDICVISPNQLHNSRALYPERFDLKDPNCEYLYFDPETLLRDFFTTTYSFQSFFYLIRQNSVTILSEEKHPKSCRLLRMIIDEMRSPAYNRNIVKGLLLSFWIDLVRIASSSSADCHTKNSELTEIYPAMSYIQTHYSQKISTSRLARECHMSLSHFRSSFTGILGYSAARYIERIRLEKSCELLLYTEMSMTEIAYQCGFSSTASFNRIFSAKYNVPPTVWKNERRNIKKVSYTHSVFIPH